MVDNSTIITRDEREIRIEVEGVTASTIYEGGILTQISAEQLIDNIIAIRQLINNHNLIAKDNTYKEQTINKLNSQIEYLKTSPFISIVSGIINIVSSVIVALGVNLLSSEKPDTAKGYILVITGSVLLLVASLSSIFYPYARGWFNKKKS